MTYSPYFSVALAAIQAAEKIILQNYQAALETELKSDQSPVTVADKAAEQIIRQHILQAFPDHTILGEEAGTTQNTSPFLWIIDPIDGTKNYVRNIPLFATQIALMKDEEIILGLSNAPAIHELMYAEKGKGAFLNDQRITVSNLNQLKAAYLSYGGIGYFQRKGHLASLLKLEADTRGHRGYGEFWSYHLLAQGKIDVMIEADTKIWDIAALALIVEEAGGKVTDIAGNKITSKTNSMIATNGLLQAEVVGYFT